jgi:Ca2+-transporting ATPase
VGRISQSKTNWWARKLPEVFEELESSKNGLTEVESKSRILKYGLNVISKASPIPYLKMVYDQLFDFLVLILFIAGILAVFLGDMRSASVIFAIIIINGIIGFSQEFKTQKELAALKKILPLFAKVLRDGQEKKVHAKFIVPGDILILQEGDEIPADGRIIEAYSFATSEAALSGESNPQKKKVGDVPAETELTDVDNMVFAGTHVASGEAKVVVITTGIETAFGKIAAKTAEIKKSLSPLQVKTKQIGKIIGLVAVGVMVVIIGIRLFSHQNLLDSFMLGVAVAASVVPEGLPATVSVALAIGARKLAEKRTLAKKLSAVETLGSTTVICTDKTGTLTEGLMQVEEVWYLRGEEEKERLKLIAALCNDASINGDEKLGDVTEIALLEWLKKENFDWRKVRRESPKKSEIPFSSEAKFMQTTYIISEKKTILEKGAPEILADRARVSLEEKNLIDRRVSEFAKKSLRTLAFSYNNDFVGIVGLSDPVRSEVPKAIKICEQAKIRVIMVTGDNPETAKAIAKKVGILGEVFTGEDLKKMSDLKLRSILLKESIFARISPIDKYRIVENLKNMGEIVAVTGDGVNDAPALKRADIGIAMGKTGTDVAKEAADLVIIDDNFATIVDAVREGRVIFDNIKKFVFYIFAHNVAELTTVLLGMLLGLPLPMTAVQILAIDLGFDITPSISFIAEKAEAHVSSSGPRDRRFPLMNKGSIGYLLYLGTVIGILSVLNFWLVLRSGGSYFTATTIAFSTLVFCQLINLHEVRAGRETLFTRRFFENKWAVFATLFTMVFLAAVIYIPPIQTLLETTGLSFELWLRIFFTGVVFVLVEEVYKYFLRRKSLANQTEL